MTKEEYKDAIEVSVIFHEGQRMFAVPKQVVQQEPVGCEGAIVNGRVYADRLEHDYKFECEAGPLHLCNDWVEFRRCFEWLAQHTPQPAQQEPIYQYQMANGSWIDQTKESHDYNARHGQATVRVVYTSPPAQRKPLTDEEIDELSRTMVKGDKSVNWLCRAIEAAHGTGEKK